MEKEWVDITDNYSERSRHYNGKYLLKSMLLDEEVEIQIYSFDDDEYVYEIFVNSEKFYGSCYPREGAFEIYEQMKNDIYKESFKKNKYSKNFINRFADKYNLGIAFDSFFSGFDKVLESLCGYDDEDSSYMFEDDEYSYEYHEDEDEEDDDDDYE